MPKLRPELPRLREGFTPYSLNPNFPKKGRYEPLVDFKKGETYWQVDTKHIAVAAAVDIVFLDAPTETETRSTREQKRIARIADYISTQASIGIGSELAVFIEKDAADRPERPEVLLYTRSSKRQVLSQQFLPLRTLEIALS